MILRNTYIHMMLLNVIYDVIVLNSVVKVNDKEKLGSDITKAVTSLSYQMLSSHFCLKVEHNT